MDKKYNQLLEFLRQYNSLAVAFSGGVDSTLLLKAAKDALKDDVVAITAITSATPKKEALMADEICNNLNVKHITFSVDINDIPKFTDNPIDRCYHCKKYLFTHIREIAMTNGADTIVEGTNADDNDDYRPGMKAISELSVISPLNEVGMTKSEIRKISKELKLPTYDKPSTPCLATRIPYGDEITIDKLDKIEKAEEVLYEYGFDNFRVRLHSNLARIEVEPENFERMMREDKRTNIVKELKQIGFDYVSLDLSGFSSGSMNIFSS